MLEKAVAVLIQGTVRGIRSAFDGASVLIHGTVVAYFRTVIFFEAPPTVRSQQPHHPDAHLR